VILIISCVKKISLC